MINVLYTIVNRTMSGTAFMILSWYAFCIGSVIFAAAMDWI